MSSHRLADNDFHEYAYTLDSATGQATYYRDSTLQASVSYSSAHVTAALPLLDALYIGGSACGSRTFDGTVERFAMFPRVLDSSELANVPDIWHESSHYFDFR
jgi:hypothetical protein